MNRFRLLLNTYLICLLILPTGTVRAQADLPVVHAVLFFSPTCGHCEYVINNTLLPMMDEYEDQLQVIAIDVTQQQGRALFLSAMQKFKLEQAGVPLLVIDDLYLVGSVEISERFPGLVDGYLSQGGVDWPDLPGLADFLVAQGGTPEPSPAPVPGVKAVLFYRSSCGHCQEVTEQVIPPLFEKYGAQLEIFGVDVSLPEGLALYRAAIERFEIESFGVPTLIVGDQVLFGGTEIQENVTGVIEGYLDRGGVNWPDIPGLDKTITEASADATSTAASTQASTVQTPPYAATISPADSPVATPGILRMEIEASSWQDRFIQDPAGNTLSVIVLIGMLGALAWAIYLFVRGRDPLPENGEWIIPVLCVFGAGVAGYLAFVETTRATAVCGPVGDCNTVQQSQYARLFGVLPIGVLGLVGYAAILLLWLAARFNKGRRADLAAILLFVITVFGTLFSLYLTFLEPFVIGATCIWCLTSAVLMTALMLLSARQARPALTRQQNLAYSQRS